MTKEKYKLRKRLIKTGGSSYSIIPAEWLKAVAERFHMKVVKTLDMLIYDNYIEIRPVKEK